MKKIRFAGLSSYSELNDFKWSEVINLIFQSGQYIRISDVGDGFRLILK